VEVRDIVQTVLRDIGYTDTSFGMDANAVAISNMIQRQSPDIAQGVAGRGLAEFADLQGAGDQGMMFGFACTETPELMPAPVMLAHRILRLAAEKRKSGAIPYLRPDSKSQVTLEYEGYKPIRAHTIVVSHQHSPDVKYDTLKEGIIEGIIRPALADTGLIDKDTKFFINPTGRFVTGGPMGDTGLTGRKIIVDTYGGMGRHGGGAYSGKDPSKVDRSASYMARYIAKNIVAAGLATRAEIQLSYAIGVPFPISISVDTFGTGTVPDAQIAASVEKTFDCTPAGIIRTLDLKKPIFRKTVNYGHFGRPGFTWETTDKVAELKANLG
jgi:S-adenosylmethionine synthetase